MVDHRRAGQYVRVLVHAIQHKTMEPVARPAVIGADRLEDDQWPGQPLRFAGGELQREVVV